MKTASSSTVAVASASNDDPAGHTVAARLAAARARPDHARFLELLDDAERPRAWSRHELIDAAVGWAARLQDAGLRRGDRVIVIAPHGLVNYAAFLGAMLVDVIPSILAPPSPKIAPQDHVRTLDALLEVARPRALIADAASMDDAVLRRFEIVIPASAPRSSSVLPAPTANPDDTAFIQYSSGTTGHRKGVAITHRALLWQVDRYAETIGLDTADRVASWLPLYHDMGLVACFLMPVLRGTPITAMCPFAWARRPQAWIDLVDRSEATLSWLPNFAYAFLARQADESALERRSLASLRGIVNCSEPIRAESHAAFESRFRACGLRPGALASSYAMAENTFAVTSGGFGVPLATVEHRGCTRVSSGIPLPDHEVRILDAHGNAVPEGEEGEIEIASPCVLRAYDRNPEATRRAIVHGRLRTGDLGFLHGGHLFVTGRLDDRINIRGHNVHPEDVEHAAGAVVGVVPGRVAAIAVPNTALGSDDLVVIAESREPEEDRAHVAGRVRAAVSAAVGIGPTDVRIVEHMWLRKSSSGKIARRACRERYLETTPGDERVLDILDRVVRQRHSARVTRSTPIMSAGLIDSLGLVDLLAALEREIGVTIDAAVLAEAGRLDRVGDFERLVTLARGRSNAPLEVSAIDAPPRLTSDAADRSGFDRRSWWTRRRLRARGHLCGRGLRVRGPLLLRLEGETGSQISIGRNVTLMPGVDLKIRERGRITIGDGAMLDTNVRLVAANDAHLVVGADTRIAMATIVNAGTDVTIGADVLIGAHTMIVSSDHLYDGDGPIRTRGYRYAPVRIGCGAWLASSTVVLPGSTVGTGSVLGAGSVLDGTIPARMVAAGRPARVIRARDAAERRPDGATS